jgi:hypothetical protein
MERKIILALLLSFALISLAEKPGADPFLGQWALDVAASRYPAGTCPASMTIEISVADPGIRYRSDTVLRNGSVVHAYYTARYDGASAIVMGDHGMLLPVSLKRPNPNTVVATYTRALEVVATSRRVVSADSHRMIITTTSHDLLGRQVTNVGIYRRVKRAEAGISRAAGPGTLEIKNRVKFSR